MNTSQALVDLAPLVRILLLGGAIALAPLLWIVRRQRQGHPVARWRAITVFTLFLTFDLVLFGAFTRLTDSGLGCPDWPGCYGNASPLGAHHEIAAAQSAMPSGPVTQRKAWVEMIHRYLATGVGALITVLCVVAWRQWRRRDGAPAPSPWWATATLVWVCVQGAFGALTVTMKLYPAVVTGHLLGGLALIALLAAQDEAFAPRPLASTRALRCGVAAVVLLALLQITLGGWVSTNYAVLACSDFPQCQGSWWPEMDFAHGFTLRRGLGTTASGDWLPFAALTAIHYMHRLVAYVLLVALVALAAALARAGDRASRRFAFGLAAVAAWQLGTGLSNVVLGWPLAAAVGHTGGAAALVLLLTRLGLRLRQGAAQRSPAPSLRPAASTS
ncbi:COX15/CtaA family protein [Ideonella sp. BN130291]|uniref:COX15/CtaA family protein n=1 Tax=Ideonella sp. BN130291 TaxID=3112940 RepID=UPI002E2556AA|nr:COX15/CtaA family protein [Ideonella sp. BN130291]